MKSISIGKNIFILLFLFLSLAFCLPSFAKDICQVTKLKVRGVKGQVVSQGKYEEPIPGIKVELFRLSDEALVESVRTDKEGFFTIDNVKKGKYRLIVWFIVGGQTEFKYNLILEVAKRRKENDQILYIRLGLDCFRSDAKVIDKKTPLESR